MGSRRVAKGGGLGEPYFSRSGVVAFPPSRLSACPPPALAQGPTISVTTTPARCAPERPSRELPQLQRQEPDAEHPVVVNIDWCDENGEVCDWREVWFDVFIEPAPLQWFVDESEWCLGDAEGPGGNWQTEWPNWLGTVDWQTALWHEKNVWVWWRAKYYWINWQTLEEGPDEWSDPAG